MKLTLVRHGQTTENLQRIVQGQMPGHLSQQGIQQAEAAAQQLYNEKFDVIYCSDLQRCLDTLEPITKGHASTPVVITEELRERFAGSYQGKVVDLPYWNSLPGTETTRKYPGGESWQDVKDRIRPFLNQLYQEHPEYSVLIVSHAGVVRAIRSYLENRSLEDVFREPVPNGGVWVEQMVSLLV